MFDDFEYAAGPNSARGMQWPIVVIFSSKSGLAKTHSWNFGDLIARATTQVEIHFESAPDVAEGVRREIGRIERFLREKTTTTTNE